MKTHIKLLLLLVSILLFTTCKKGNPFDYRYKYEGKYSVSRIVFFYNCTSSVPTDSIKETVDATLYTEHSKKPVLILKLPGTKLLNPKSYVMQVNKKGEILFTPDIYTSDAIGKFADKNNFSFNYSVYGAPCQYENRKYIGHKK